MSVGGKQIGVGNTIIFLFNELLFLLESRQKSEGGALEKKKQEDIYQDKVVRLARLRVCRQVAAAAEDILCI